MSQRDVKEVVGVGTIKKEDGDLKGGTGPSEDFFPKLQPSLPSFLASLSTQHVVWLTASALTFRGNNSTLSWCRVHWLFRFSTRRNSIMPRGCCALLVLFLPLKARRKFGVSLTFLPRKSDRRLR